MLKEIANTIISVMFKPSASINPQSNLKFFNSFLTKKQNVLNSIVAACKWLISSGDTM